MNIDACIKKINKYLASENVQPLLVNVKNGDDLDQIRTHFNVGGNEIIQASSFCNDDELPRIEMLLEKISAEKKNYFLFGLTSFLRFLGEDEIKKYLSNIINMTIAGHVIVFTYQCERLLDFSDPRLSRNICMLDGDEIHLPKLVFVSKTLPTPSSGRVVFGINKAVEEIETSLEDKIQIITAKHKGLYPNTIYSISDLSKAYEIVIEKDNSLSVLEENAGTSAQWDYLLSLLNSGKSFAEICNNDFGSCQSLEIAIPNYRGYSENKKWLFFIALKVFGARNNACLADAANTAETYSKLIREIFRSILKRNHKDKSFKDFYQQRKSLLSDLGNPVNEVVDFCSVVIQKGTQAIYCLTDNTQQEKELILELIEKYYQEMSKRELEEILIEVYPDLYEYIKDYRFNLPLLDKYFSAYTHSKVINKIVPELEELVNEQAIRRDYNYLLEPRTAKIDEIDKTDSQLYFVDALGVEYLSFILAKCKEKQLLANTTICCANLPSITSKNKEFVSDFETRGLLVNSIKDLDEIKHHGVNDYDYRQRKQPIHLVKELEIINDTLDNIKVKLSQESCKKAIIVSDHGASRLAVIHETENMWEMQSQGVHSGRCCPISDVDVQSEFATEENGFWVIANYDRFKGGRKANVEVHGGATLEEVVVPIIEITKLPEDIEVSILDEDKVITVSFRKKAAIRLFSKTKLNNLSVAIDGVRYDAKEQDNNIYLVEMPLLKKAKRYTVDVYMSNNLIAPGLSFEIKKESSSERDIL